MRFKQHIVSSSSYMIPMYIRRTVFFPPFYFEPDFVQNDINFRAILEDTWAPPDVDDDDDEDDDDDDDDDNDGDDDDHDDDDDDDDD